MKELFNTFLLSEDKFISETHWQSAFTYSACRQFTRNKERIQKFKEIADSRNIYQKELDKVFFQHDMAYEDFKDLIRGTVSDKILRDKAFNITKNPKYDRYQRGLASMNCNIVHTKTKNKLTNYTNQLIENLKNEKYAHLL